MSGAFQNFKDMLTPVCDGKLNSRVSLCLKPLLFTTVMVVSLFIIGCVTSTKDSSVTHSDSSQEDLQGGGLSDGSLFSFSNNNQLNSDTVLFNGKSITPGSSPELIKVLKENGLWSLGPRAEISPLLVNSFPDDLDELEVESKKKVFFNTLLPVVIAALNEVQAERQKLLIILSELNGNQQSIIFSEDQPSWQEKLSEEKLLFIKNITRKYRHKDSGELLKRINVVPVSLVLAQGAIESSWGTSRFANLGNNLFGMWTWGERGIIPLDRKDGMRHKVAVYDSILESVRAYLLTINRVQAYNRLRDLRNETMNSINLTEGLIYYSERRDDYVEDLQSVITFNKLAVFDKYHLSFSSEVSI